MLTIEEELHTQKFNSEIQKAHLNILFTASWLKAIFLQRIKVFGISLEQYNVLRILRGALPHGLCVLEIRKRMIDKNSNVTRIIDKLVAKNLVLKQRSETDKREWNVSISTQALELLQKIDQEFEQNPLHQSILTQEQAQTLNQLLDLIRIKKA
ncbi:MAG: MarR family transcriptional regulator [Microscillaceae bacterium]|nr:MarR family transcriptional regulator [Microscillaceae bacterium]MDW8460908.1 MarR family transcriptional regulator [Cytophagales bacterium]